MHAGHSRMWCDISGMLHNHGESGKTDVENIKIMHHLEENIAKKRQQCNIRYFESDNIAHGT